MPVYWVWLSNTDDDRLTNNTTQTFKKMNKEKIFNGYITAALWSSSHNLGNYEFLDETHSIEDIDFETLQKMKAEVFNFISDNYTEISVFMIETGVDESQVGQSLWLNSNGHGAGFFDWFNDSADHLDKAARKVKSFDLYVGDDNLIYSM